jgi:hypothetical protein
MESSEPHLSVELGHEVRPKRTLTDARPAQRAELGTCFPSATRTGRRGKLLRWANARAYGAALISRAHERPIISEAARAPGPLGVPEPRMESTGTNCRAQKTDALLFIRPAARRRIKAARVAWRRTAHSLPAVLTSMSPWVLRQPGRMTASANANVPTKSSNGRMKIINAAR